MNSPELVFFEQEDTFDLDLQINDLTLKQATSPCTSTVTCSVSRCLGTHVTCECWC
ncbi:FDLD family class I lanthipeptide [Paenibacillus sp. FSL L8-0641]|uniref:FDLD family class I lanthipeptide n=1 Tax=Paenibacillus sp. FSL L8-0641 TaxID=2921605 RepID=UPI004048CA1B